MSEETTAKAEDNATAETVQTHNHHVVCMHCHLRYEHFDKLVTFLVFLDLFVRMPEISHAAWRLI